MTFLAITKENINNFPENEYSEVTGVSWQLGGELDKKIIDKFPNIKKFGCQGNLITTLEPLSGCVNLEILYCFNNCIKSLKPLSKCINLREIICSLNGIISFKPLRNCLKLEKISYSRLSNEPSCLFPIYKNVDMSDIIYDIIRTKPLKMESLPCFINLVYLDFSYLKIKTLNSLSKCVNLRELYCAHNNLTSLEPLSNCTNLRVLDCQKNCITSLEPLSNHINLKKLYCAHNNLISLEPLSNHINLKSLNCAYNNLISLEPLSNCTNLKLLNCSDNNLTSLEPLSNRTNLKSLDCSDNNLTSLQPLSNCVNLEKIYCDDNKITSLEPLSNCINLKDISCDNNKISSLGPLIYLTQLRYLSYSNNPMEIQTIQIQRMINRLITNENSSIYNDKQNIHDVEIQRTVCESVQSLLKDPKNIFSIDDIINSDLDKTTIEFLVEYCQDQTIHSIHLITYQELISYVWNRIQISDHKLELLKILQEQISDSACKCFTGRFNRTLSVLVGFYDDIKINISDNSRIGAIILNIKEKIIPYDPYMHKEIATTYLLNVGYTMSDIRLWVDAVDEFNENDMID